MAVTCNGSASVKLGWNFLDSRTDGSQTRNADSLSSKISYTGSAIDNVVTKKYTIAASGTQGIDLAGSLTDPAGNTITWTKLMGLIIILDDETTATSISVGPYSGSNPLAGLFADASDLLKIYNGGSMCWMTPAATPVTVTGGSADALRIVNNDASNAATVYVAFLGKA